MDSFLLIETGDFLLLEDGVSKLILEIGVVAPVVVPTIPQQVMEAGNYASAGATIATQYNPGGAHYPFACFTEEAVALIWIKPIEVHATATLMGRGRAQMKARLTTRAEAKVLRRHSAEARLAGGRLSIRSECRAVAPVNDAEVALLLSLLD